MGEGVVRLTGDACHVFAINTREEDVSIDIDPREIIPCEYAALDFEPGSEDEIEVNPNNSVTDKESLIIRLKEIIPTDHLNEEEKISVQNLIRDFEHVFLLPGDPPLPCTDIVQHFIPTETNLPVNAKQYCHPVIHKEFIQKDIQQEATRRDY